ncbi:hypothetical protein HDU98_007614 [Podochytrium sp. JEL0797]|nr:hypothetical protein HDU98_007614 [Podochytrium sp. JEL0797]
MSPNTPSPHPQSPAPLYTAEPLSTFEDIPTLDAQIDMPASDNQSPPAETSAPIETADQHPSDDAQTSTLLGIFPIRYANPELKYFADIRPQELEGLISSQDFHIGMKSLNESLSKLRTLKDYTPLARTFLLFAFIICGIGEDNLFSKFWWTIGLSIIFLIMMATYTRESAIFHTLTTHTKSFNDLDTQLEFTLAPHSHRRESPFFAYRREHIGVLVDWRIVVSELNKSGNTREWLPAYTPRGLAQRLGSMTGIGMGEGMEMSVWGQTRLPSYRSAV